MHTIKANCTKLETIDLKICSSSIFSKTFGNSFSTTFYASFWQKNISHVIPIDWPNFIVWLPLLHDILGNMCIANVCFSDCDVINFEINVSFLIKWFFCMTKIQEPKELLRWNKNHFASLLNSSQLLKIVSDMRLSL